MDWKIFLTTFITVFFAELGDKTQLATLGISSASENRLSVFLDYLNASIYKSNLYFYLI